MWKSTVVFCACTSRGAPLPRRGVGQACAPEFTLMRHLHPKFGSGYDWADASVNFVGVFIEIVVLLPVALRYYQRPFCMLGDAIHGFSKAL